MWSELTCLNTSQSPHDAPWHSADAWLPGTLQGQAHIATHGIYARTLTIILYSTLCHMGPLALAVMALKVHSYIAVSVVSILHIAALLRKSIRTPVNQYPYHIILGSETDSHFINRMICMYYIYLHIYILYIDHMVGDVKILVKRQMPIRVRNYMNYNKLYNYCLRHG